MNAISNPTEISLAHARAGNPPALRDALIRAAFGGEIPNEETHRRIASWSAAAAPNTLRAMASDLKTIDAYQSARQRPALPIDPADLYCLIHERAAGGAAKSSIKRLVASAVRLHDVAGLPTPVDDIVRWKLQEIRRADTRPQRQAFGLRLKGDVQDVIRNEAEMVSILKLFEAMPSDPAGVRDRALISTGYDAGLRRSELVRVQVENIERLHGGEATLLIPKSKTDQEGDGETVWLSSRSVRLIDAWLGLAGLTSGFVFRSLSYRVSSNGHLSEGAVSKILKRRCADYLAPLVAEGKIKAEDAERIVRKICGHSVRVGRTQDCFAAGVGIGAIMQGLRWTSPVQPLAYARHLAAGTSKLAAVMRRAG